MDKGYEKERFESLSIKRSVVKKFRRFCKKMSKSQSMTLRLMIDFFEVNGVSPNESLGPKIQTLEVLIKKRINGLIAIMKDIEKTQTKPTAAMLLALLEGTKDEDKEDDYDFEPQKLITENEELTYYREEYFKYKANYHRSTQELVALLSKTKYVKGSFGKGYLKLEISKEEIENLKNENNI